MEKVTIPKYRPDPSFQLQTTGRCVPLSPRPPWAKPLENQDGRGERGRGEGELPRGSVGRRSKKTPHPRPLSPRHFVFPGHQPAQAGGEGRPNALSFFDCQQTANHSGLP
jgi:hypothetical protein